MLPQAAQRLDADPAIGPDEVRIAVERLNLDAASLPPAAREAHGGDGDAVRAAVLDIIADPRQDAEPGHRLRRHAHRHRRRGRPGVAARPRRRATGWPPSSRSPSPRCAITDGLAGWDGRSEQVPARRARDPVRPLDRRGAARRPARRRRRWRCSTSAARRPLTARVVRARPAPGRSSSSARPASPAPCSLAAARAAGATELTGLVRNDGRGRPRCAPPGSPTRSSSPTPPTRSRVAAGASARPADVTVVCVDVPGLRTRRDPGHRRRRHGDLLLHGHVVRGGGPGRGGAGRGRDDAGRQRLPAGARRPWRSTCYRAEPGRPARSSTRACSRR